VGINLENSINKNNKKDNNTKKGPDTLKKSEVVSNDDKKSKITAPITLVPVTSTPAKASEQRSRLSRTHHNDKPKPPTSVGVANQLLQPEITRAKEFKRIPPNQPKFTGCKPTKRLNIFEDNVTIALGVIWN